jgi:hypothetical protein
VTRERNTGSPVPPEKVQLISVGRPVAMSTGNEVCEPRWPSREFSLSWRRRDDGSISFVIFCAVIENACAIEVYAGPVVKGSDLEVGQRVSAYPDRDGSRFGVIVEDFGEAPGQAVIVGTTQIAEPSRRWAVQLDDGSLIFADSADLKPAPKHT